MVYNDRTGQGKLPQELVTDNALLKRKYESEELGGAEAVYATPTNATPLASFGGESDTAKLMAWAASSSPCVILPNRAVSLTQTVYVPAWKWIVGGGFASVIQPAAGGTFDDGWLLVFNSTDRANWVVQYPNMLVGGMSKVRFLNPDAVAGARGIFAFGSYVFEDLRFRGYTQAIKKPDTLYCDSFEVRRVIVDMPQSTTEYQVYLGGLGDGCIIEQFHAPILDPGSTVATKGLYIHGVAGGLISHCIGGDHKLYQCHNVKIVGCHYEVGQTIIDSSSVSIDTTTFWPAIKIPLVFVATDGERYVSSIRDSSFVFAASLYEWTGAHIQMSAEHALKIDNTHSRWTVNGVISNSQPHGLRVVKGNDASLTDYMDLSYLFSERAQIDHNYTVRRSHAINQIDTLFPGLASAASNASISWKEASGTYYYRCIVLYDNLRKLGRNSISAEVSYTATIGGSGVLLVLDFGGKPKLGKVRVFRGTVAGSYDSYADVDCCGAVYLNDNGSDVNGFAWQARTAGTMDTINSSLNDSNIAWRGEMCEVTAGVQPSTGSWRLGDFVRRVTTSNPIDGNSMYFLGYARLTQGPNHASGTDWAPCRVSTVSPAV